jgi:type I restriction-modification system DNA methylase subunit
MQRLKEFTKTFDTLTHGHNRGSVFADFVEIAACTAHQVPYHARALPKDAAFERVEQSYLDAIKRYDKAEIEQIVTLYATASLGVMENRADFLGTAYMQLEIGNDRSGQFFTPPEVSRMMADMTFTGAADVINAKGYITVSEPAAGAGGMLIEAANALQRQGFDPRMTMYFQATDIDRTCFNMAYFQLSTLGLCGDVIHGNTLSLEEWDRRGTPQMLIVDAGLASRREVELSPAPPAKQPEPVQPATRPGTQTEMDFASPPEKTYPTPDPAHRAQFQPKDKDRGIDR